MDDDDAYVNFNLRYIIKFANLIYDHLSKVDIKTMLWPQICVRVIVCFGLYANPYDLVICKRCVVELTSVDVVYILHSGIYFYVILSLQIPLKHLYYRHNCRP